MSPRNLMQFHGDVATTLRLVTDGAELEQLEDHVKACMPPPVAPAPKRRRLQKLPANDDATVRKL